MEITEVRIKLVNDPGDKLRGFATITIDDALVIRDLKIIEGNRGLFVAMPSRKLQDRCPSCACKNALRSRYCNDCGRRLRERRGPADSSGRERLYADIAHPIHQEGRELVQTRVVSAYHVELDASRKVGYVAQRFDDLDYDAYGEPAPD
jgi:stage V sporulation protein G